MITTTWQILWIPRFEAGQSVADDEDPQPASTATASRNGTTRGTSLS